MSMPVSIVIPLFNAESYIREVLDAVCGQQYEGPIEVIVVNDGSTDRSPELLRAFEKSGKIKVLHQANQGAVAATNRGFKEARSEIICSVDSDVVLHQDWLGKVIGEFRDPNVGAVQGYYKTAPTVSFWAKMMGYDVEKRYDDIPGRYVTQVCTGNTAYRRKALDDVGLFDPSFIYGYDNDMSYRLVNAGYKLIFRKDALCDHYWKADLKSFLKQQYRSGYGRMQLLQKHADRKKGDSVSGIRMIMQVPLTLLPILVLLTALLAAIGNHPARFFFVLAGILFGVLLCDRIAFSLGVLRKQRDFLVLLMPFVHLLRNAAWSCALIRWMLDKRCPR